MFLVQLVDLLILEIVLDICPQIHFRTFNNTYCIDFVFCWTIDVIQSKIQVQTVYIHGNRNV